MKRYIRASELKFVDVSDYQELSSTLRDGRDTYALYRKLENGKGRWAAAKYTEKGYPDKDHAFEITYAQALGNEPLSESGVRELSKYLGKILLPRR